MRCVDEASRGSKDEGDSSEVDEKERRRRSVRYEADGWPQEMLPEGGSR